MASVPGKMSATGIYTDGTYLEKNPLWHSDEAPFKAAQIIRMLERNRLKPKTIAEVGCGAGEVLRRLQGKMNSDCRFWGYEISPQALRLCDSKANEKLQFKLPDISREEDTFFDMILVLDVIEHVEDYFGFLRSMRPKSDLKIFHFPLDLSVQAAEARTPEAPGVVRTHPLFHHRDSFGKFERHGL